MAAAVVAARLATTRRSSLQLASCTHCRPQALHSLLSDLIRAELMTEYPCTCPGDEWSQARCNEEALWISRKSLEVAVDSAVHATR
jgi:hypothetical protein